MLCSIQKHFPVVNLSLQGSEGTSTSLLPQKALLGSALRLRTSHGASSQPAPVCEAGAGRRGASKQVQNDYVAQGSPKTIKHRTVLSSLVALTCV